VSRLAENVFTFPSVLIKNRPHAFMAHSVVISSRNTCPHCRRKVRQSPNFAVVAPFSTTVSVFYDSLTFLRQCGQGLIRSHLRALLAHKKYWKTYRHFWPKHRYEQNTLDNWPTILHQYEEFSLQSWQNDNDGDKTSRLRLVQQLLQPVWQWSLCSDST